MAAAGLGSTLMPAPLLTRLNIGPSWRCARSPSRPDWHVALIWKPGHYMSHAARAWLRVCEEVLAQPQR
jgi:DNA-binding transcriptional LysR family regulator